MYKGSHLTSQCMVKTELSQSTLDSLYYCFLVATSIGRNKESENMRDSIHNVLRSIPQGLTLGPSLTKEGHLGLWCVGRVLEKGTLLGLEQPDKTRRKKTLEEVCFTMGTEHVILHRSVQQQQILQSCCVQVKCKYVLSFNRDYKIHAKLC